MRSLLFVMLVILSFFGLSSAQYRDNVRRHTAAERMEAHDKRTARQAEQAGTTYRSRPFVTRPNTDRKSVDKIVRMFAKDLAESPQLLEPRIKDLTDMGFNVLRLFESFTCEVKTRKSPKNGAICNLLESDGGRTFFSFRKGIYGFEAVSDITFVNGEIVSAGYLNQGFLIDLGAVPIDSIGATTGAFARLGLIKPATSADEFVKLEAELRSGYMFGGSLYFSKIDPKPGHTFLGRFVAYRNDVLWPAPPLRSINISLEDQRIDVIVAFHVLSMEPDGGPTIIWRLLKSAESPKL